MTFLGSHLDVVPANPETWTVDPFTMTRDGDSLYGRGTTDCLGHVALITDLFCSLAELKPKLQRTVMAIFIANEENGEIEGALLTLHDAHTRHRTYAVDDTVSLMGRCRH